MTDRTVRRGGYALAAIAAVAAIVLTVVGLARGSSGRAFPSLVPTAAAASRPRLTLPNDHIGTQPSGTREGISK